MSNSTEAELPSGLIKVSVRSKKNSQSGKIKKTTTLRLSSSTARKAKLHSGLTFQAFISADGTITLIPLVSGSQTLNEERRNEILSALEKTHLRFGNALRRLAE